MIATHPVGKTDLRVSALGFGGGTIGGIGDIISDDQAAEVVQAAWEGGIRYYDTAPLYGHGLSEKRLGSWLGSKPRDEFVVSSKAGRLLVPRGEGYRDPLMRDREPFDARYDYTYDGARRSLESSLERLGLERIDILLCHDLDVWTHGDDHAAHYETAARGLLPALSDLRSEGLIRAFGLGVNEKDVCRRALRDFDVDCFLLAGRFTLLEQAPLDDLLPECVAKSVSVIIGGPFNSGLLAQTERRRATYDYRPVDDSMWNKAQRIREVCAAHDVDARAAALQYPLRHPAVTSVIPGVWRATEVQANFELFATSLPDALWDDLATAEVVRRI